MFLELGGAVGVVHERRRDGEWDALPTVKKRAVENFVQGHPLGGVFDQDLTNELLDCARDLAVLRVGVGDRLDPLACLFYAFCLEWGSTHH